MPYIKTNLENIISIKKNVIFIIQPRRKPTNNQFMGESHDFWELKYMLEGKLNVQCENKSYPMQENDILFYKPNLYHQPFAVEPNLPTQFVNISFECNSAAMSFFEDYHGQLSPKTKKLLEDVIEEGKKNFVAVAEGPIARSVTKPDAPFGGQQIYKLKLELFLLTLLQEIQSESSQKIFTNKNEFHKSLIKEIKSYLSENIYSNLSIEDICKKFNYSSSFISKLFRDKTGVSIIHYYKGIKIEEAKTLLENKEHSITQIAENLGFGNRYNFSKLFKSFVGVSPAEYKKQNK